MPDGSITFPSEPAVRVNTAIILALAGPSGSGKTKSALELAVGLAGQDGKILIVDSEGSRAKHYADEYTFFHYDWRPPYSPKELGSLLQFAERKEFAVIIVDSMSSEHEDEGGLCDMAEEAYAAQKPDSKNSAAAWARPKAEHKRYIVRWLRQARCHVIFCLRATEKVRFEPVEINGRKTTKVVPVGWTPISEKNLLYDVTTSLLFTPDNPGAPQPIKLYDRHRPFFPPDRKVTREAGLALAQWAAGGAPAPASEPLAQQRKPESDAPAAAPARTAFRIRRANGECDVYPTIEAWQRTMIDIIERRVGAANLDGFWQYQGDIIDDLNDQHREAVQAVALVYERRSGRGA